MAATAFYGFSKKYAEKDDKPKEKFAKIGLLVSIATAFFMFYGLSYVKPWTGTHSGKVLTEENSVYIFSWTIPDDTLSYKEQCQDVSLPDMAEVFDVEEVTARTCLWGTLEKRLLYEEARGDSVLGITYLTQFAARYADHRDIRELSAFHHDLNTVLERYGGEVKEMKASFTSRAYDSP